MDEIMELRLLARSALPIDNIASVMIPPDDGISIVWVDVSERPDLAVLVEQSAQDGGYATCTWFYGRPGTRDMLIGMRIAMEHPTSTVFVLTFKVEQFEEWLSTIARYGKIWILPEPAPDSLVGTSQKMDPDILMERVGQGLLIALESPGIAELRARLSEWKRIK